MPVYHGSYCEIVNPDIKYSRNKLDFGKGFMSRQLKNKLLVGYPDLRG